MSTVFMICGNTAAGKSTYSMALSKQENAICFSIDPWMMTLYGEDYNPEENDFSWLLERLTRCQTQIRQVAELLIQKKVNVILDFGFGDIETRRMHKEWAEKLGAEVSLHFLDVPVEERRRRVQHRNQEQGETFAFEVTDEMFDYVNPLFSPPSEDELKNGLFINGILS